MKTRSGFTLMRLGACAALICSLAVASTRAAEIDLVKVRRQFDSYLVKLEKARKEQRSKWQVAYARALQGLEKKLQSEGKLDELIAVKQELKRFKESRTVLPETPGDAPDGLRSLQDRFRKNRSGFELEHNQKVIKLAEQYDGKLANTQKKLTIEGKIDEALQIREERRSAEEDATVTAARFELAALEDSGFGDGADAGEESRGGEGQTGASKTSLPEHGVKIYSDRAAPTIAGLKFKRLTLTRTDHSTLAGGVKVTAQFALRDNVSKEVSTYYRHERRNSGWHLRLTLRNARAILENVIVTVQFYTKNAAPQGRIDPQLYAIRRVPLPVLDASPVTLDFPAVQTWMNQTKRRGSSRHISGTEMHGVIIGVFDANEKLLYQEVTERGLAVIASASIPEETREEQLQRLMRVRRDAERAYRETVNKFGSRGVTDSVQQEEIRKASDAVRDAYDTYRRVERQR